MQAILTAYFHPLPPLSIIFDFLIMLTSFIVYSYLTDIILFL